MKTQILRSRRVLVALAVGIGLSTTACFGPPGNGAPCQSGSMTVSAVSIYWEPFGPPNSYTAKLRATVVNGTSANVSNATGSVLVHAVTAPNGPNNTTDWDATAYASGGGELAPGQSAVWEGVAVISVIAGSQPPDVVASSWQARSATFFWGTGVPFNLGCSNYSGPPIG